MKSKRCNELPATEEKRREEKEEKYSTLYNNKKTKTMETDLCVKFDTLLAKSGLTGI